MAVKKINLYVLLILLLIPMAVGSNINGWGSDLFFGYDQQNTFFNVDYQHSFNETVAFGSSNKPLVCDIDTSSSANELIIFSGLNINLYSGVGNTLTLLDTYTASSTLNDVTCLSNIIHIATDDNYIQLIYEDGEITEKSISSIGAAYDISCVYSSKVCAVLYEDAVFLFDEFGDTLYPTFGYENPALSYTNTDTIQFASRWMVYVYDGSDTITYHNTSAGSDPTLFTTRTFNSDDINERVVFGDFGDDGLYEWCYPVFDNQVTDTYTLVCYDLDDAHINSEQIQSGADATIFMEDTFNPSGSSPVVCGRSSSGTMTCYEPYTDFVKDYTGDFITRWKGQDTLFFYNSTTIGSLSDGKIYNATTMIADTGLTSSYNVVADITGDTRGELILSKNGETFVAFDDEPDYGLLPPSITFASNAIDGGFYGYYDGDICSGTTITFEAQECVGDLTECNYYNSNPTEQERLQTSCGLGAGAVYGSYDSNHPTVDCTYASEGDYEVIIYIQGSSPFNTTSNANTPISLTVSDSANCNNPAFLLNQPNQNASIGLENSGSADAPSEGGDIAPISDGEEVLNAFWSNLKIIIGFGLVLSVVLFLAFNGIKHPLVLILGAFIGLIIVTSIKLVPFVVSIFVGIGFLIIGLVVGFIFKAQNR